EIADMLEARLRAGMVSSLEAANARLLLQKTQQLLDTEKANLAELKSRLASHAGLSTRALDKITLARGDKALVNSRRETFTPNSDVLDKAQESALLTRLDIRAAPARYDAAEPTLRLEIARQYPDIVLS